jgi:signal transduction histidine kinase
LEEAERAAGEAQAVFYAIADGVLLTDPCGRVTAMNRALEALTGWTEAEARGRPYAEVLPLATDRADGPANLPVTWGDPDKVEQILTNLVGNAIKYSPGGGEVLVTVDVDGDTVQVSVRDQGIGMSPRDMGQLFEKFYRVDREEVRRAGGTGVGSVFRFTIPTSDELAGSGR